MANTDDVLNIRIDPTIKRALDICIATEGKSKKDFVSDALAAAINPKYVAQAKEAIEAESVSGK